MAHRRVSDDRAWEERFERSYGFWRGLVAEVRGERPRVRSVARRLRKGAHHRELLGALSLAAYQTVWR
jgi:hypothetical protein